MGSEGRIEWRERWSVGEGGSKMGNQVSFSYSSQYISYEHVSVVIHLHEHEQKECEGGREEVREGKCEEGVGGGGGGKGRVRREGGRE